MASFSTSSDAGVKVSTANNNVKVVSLYDKGYGSAGIGLFVDAGSQYENVFNSGATHFLKFLSAKVLTLTLRSSLIAVSTRRILYTFWVAFHHLTDIKIQDSQLTFGVSLVKQPEGLGARVYTLAGREYFGVGAIAASNNVAPVLQSLVNFFFPRLESWVIDDARGDLQHDVQHQSLQALLVDALHAQAFKNGGLGQPLWCSPENVGQLGEEALQAYAHKLLDPSRLVVVAEGVPHEAVVSAVQGLFLPPNSVRSALYQHRVELLANDKGPQEDLAHKKQYVDNLAKNAAAAPASSSLAATYTKKPNTYTGGEARFPRAHDSHVVVGFQGTGLSSADLPGLAVLLSHLAPTAALPASIRGKLTGDTAASTQTAKPVSYGNRGVTSKVGAALLKHEWGVSAKSFNFGYGNDGVAGVYAQASPAHAEQVYNAVAAQLKAVKSSKISSEDLEAAKHGARAAALAQADCKINLLEYAATQALAGKDVRSPEQLASQVASVTADDVARVASRVLASKPTVVAAGDVQGLPVASSF